VAEVDAFFPAPRHNHTELDDGQGSNYACSRAACSARQGGFIIPMDHYVNEQTVLTERNIVALAPYGIEPSQSDLKSFANQLIVCHLKEARFRKFLRSRRKWIASTKMEIYYFLEDSRDRGNVDEALWCAFVAAHFGRASANPDHLQAI
jgi:hypothetical protein